MTLLETLREWQNFYFMIGGASAGLIGLMFVAISMGARLVTPDMAENVRIFVNPTLFHFVTVLVTACVMLVPSHSALSFSISTGIIGLFGLRRVLDAIFATKRRTDSEPIEKGHFLWHMVLPFAGYLSALVAAIGTFLSASDFIASVWSLWVYGVAICVISLTVCAIHNTWTLVLWIAKQH